MSVLFSGDDIALRDDYATAVAAPLPASVPASVDSGTPRGSLVKVSDASNTGSIASGRFKLSGAAATTYRFEAHAGQAINSDAPFIISFVYKHTSGAFEIGLYSDNTASGNPTAGLFPTATELQLKIGADVIEAYDLTADTDYRITIEYDGTTTKWSIKGGSEYAVWTEIYRTRLITWGANSYFLVKNTNAVVEFDETRIQNSYVYDTAITIYPTFRVETSGADTFDPVITTSSGTATWQYGDGSADEVTNSVSHAIAGAQKMLVRLTNLAPANILTLESNSDELTGDIWPLDTDAMTALTSLLLEGNSFSGDLSSWTLPSGLTELRLNNNSFSGDLSSWTLPSGLTKLRLQGNSFSGDLSSWTLPSGLDFLFLTNNSFSGDLSSWTLPSDLTKLQLGTNSFADVPADYSPCVAIEDIQLQDNALSQAEVDAVVEDLFTNRASFTDATPTLNIGGTNSAPSGILQDGDPPTTGKEYIYEIVNDPEVEGFNKWVVTFTA